MLSIRRSIGKMAHIRAVMGSLGLGQTYGYKAGPLFGNYLFLRQSVSSYAIMAGINPGADGGVWAAAGPALHRVALEHEESQGGPTVTATRLGAVVAMGLVLPARNRIFVDFQGQYRLVGTVGMGPIDVPGTSGGIVGTVPRTEVNFNHAMLSLGLGVRF